MTNIDTLRHQRDDLASRLSDLMLARERLRQAEGDESAILAEIGRLGASEVEAVRRWASEGAAQGDMPEPDAGKRARLHVALVAAQARAASIKGASDDLEAAAADLSGQLRSVNARIDGGTIEALSERQRESVAVFAEFVASNVRPKLARLLAFHPFLIERAEACTREGRHDEARALYQRAEAFARDNASFDFAPSRGEVLSKVDFWSKRYAEQIAGQPETPAEEPVSNVLRIGSAA